MKKKILTVLGLVSVAALTLGSTLALLTSETPVAENVFVYGNAKIEQNEYQSDGTFQNGKKLLPTTTDITVSNGVVVGSLDGVTNAQEKIVTVTNTGSESVYYRTIIAVEAPAGARDSIVIDTNEAAGLELEAIPGYITVKGTDFKLYVATYPEELASGKESLASLLGVVMSKSTTNEQLQSFGTDGIQVLVASQAVQYSGYENKTAQEALNEAFGEITLSNHPFVPVVRVSEYETLTAAVNALDGKGTVILDEDVTESKVVIPVGADITVKGNDEVTFNGGFWVEGTLRVDGINIDNHGAQSNFNNDVEYGTAIFAKGNGQVYVNNTTFNLDWVPTENAQPGYGIKTLPAAFPYSSSQNADGSNTYVEVKNSTFNCDGQRALFIGGGLYVDNVTFNDPYRYAIQYMAVNNKATVINSTVAGTPYRDVKYLIEITTDFPSHNLELTLSNNKLEDLDQKQGGKLYVYESPSKYTVDLDTIIINGVKASESNLLELK